MATWRTRTRCRDAHAVSRVPAMRKDFLVDRYQVLEARAHGAGGRAADRAHGAARGSSSTCSIARRSWVCSCCSKHSTPTDLAVARELARARQGRERADPDGSQLSRSRDAADRFERFAQLREQMPDAWPRVAESGVSSPADAAEVARLGYRLALVGTALMQRPDPAAALARAARRRTRGARTMSDAPAAPLWIKVCGMRTRRAIEAAVEAQVQSGRFRVPRAARRAISRSPKRRSCRRGACGTSNASPCSCIRRRSCSMPCSRSVRPDSVQTGRRRIARAALAGGSARAAGPAQRCTPTRMASLPQRFLLESARSGAGETADWIGSRAARSTARTGARGRTRRQPTSPMRSRACVRTVSM